MRNLMLATALMGSLTTFAQDSSKGIFELGIRNTISTFGASGNTGQGFGGQFRIRLSERLNTEWFADILAEDVNGLAKRNDYHIGWSVMFYPLNPSEKKVVPYILAGHCFDYTKIAPTATAISNLQSSVSRLSSATQVGLGAHWYLSEHFNFSASSQYMIHLGSDIHSHVKNIDGVEQITIEEHDDGFSLEGHLLFTFSLNYKIGKLW